MEENAVSNLIQTACDPHVLRAIEQQIVQRTAGGIHDLQVAVAGDRLLVRGNTTTYYLRQLALLAVEQVLGLRDSTLIEVDITVRCSNSHLQSRCKESDMKRSE